MSAATIHQPVAFRAIHDNMRDKQRGEEKSYFSKKDAKLMKALLEKMEQEGQNASEEAACAAQEDLEELFTAHKLDKDGAHKALFSELMDWKKHEYWTTPSCIN